MYTYDTITTLEKLVTYGHEDNALRLSYDQTKTRPEIDTVINYKLGGDAQKDALFVVDNIRENGMKIKWASADTWSVQYKRKHVCDLKIGNGSLNIGPVSDVLATRVKSMSHNQESVEQLIEALRESLTGSKETFVFAH